jgi:hypothetical protein
LLCIIGVIYFIHQLTANSSFNNYLYVGILIIAGVYSNLGFILVLPGLFTYFLIKYKNYNWHHIAKYIIVVPIAALCILLAVPLFATHGFEGFQLPSAGNSYWQLLTQGCNKIGYYFTGYRHAWFIPVLFLTINAILYFKNKSNILLLTLCQLLVALISTIILGGFAYERLYTYLAPIIVIVITYALQNINIKNISIVLTLSIISLFGFQKHFLFWWNIDIDKAINTASQQLINKNISNIQLDYHYAKPALLYNYTQAHKPINCVSTDTMSISYSNNVLEAQAIISNTEQGKAYPNYQCDTIGGIICIWYR